MPITIRRRTIMLQNQTQLFIRNAMWIAFGHSYDGGSQSSITSHGQIRPRLCPDKQHFLRLGQMLDRYYDERWCPTGKHGKQVATAELNEYHAVRLKYLEGPSKVLGIPFNLVRTYVLQFVWRIRPWGHSPSAMWNFYLCIDINKFAQRFATDRDIIIPALVPQQLREMFQKAHALAQRHYFEFIDADGSFELSRFGPLLCEHRID